MKIDLGALLKENGKFLKKTVWKPYGKMLCMLGNSFLIKQDKPHT